MEPEDPKYECVCFKCNKSFFAETKRASICPACKGGPTYQSLSDMMNAVRRTQYSSDPERNEAVLATLSYCVGTLLEKLAVTEPHYFMHGCPCSACQSKLLQPLT